jgi:hypothetical protein
LNDLVLPVAATLAALAFAAPATAAVVPGQGIAGVELRMTEAQVRAAVGPPLRVTRSRGALGLLVTRLHYRGLDVDLQRLDGQAVVTRAIATRAGERTRSGVGVGSSLAAVRRLPGVRCWSEGADRYCGSGDRNTPLARVTIYSIGAHDRVTRIVVGLVVSS